MNVEKMGFENTDKIQLTQDKMNGRDVEFTVISSGSMKAVHFLATVATQEHIMTYILHNVNLISEADCHVAYIYSKKEDKLISMKILLPGI
jgi:hypothetical protein